MIFNAKIARDTEAAKRRFTELLDKGARFELREITKRSLDANALFHLWCRVLANEWGLPSVEDAKELVVGEIFGYRTIINPITSEETQVREHTATMSKERMNELMNRMKPWAQVEFGIYLPYWKEAGFEEMVSQFR